MNMLRSVDHLTVLWVSLVILSAAMVGCSGKIGAAPHSYDLAGEQVEIRMLTKSDFGDDCETYFATVGWDMPDHDDKAESRSEAFLACYKAANTFRQARAVEADPLTQESVLGVDIAAGLIGLTVDVIAKELEKDAARYQLQYRSITYDDSFWTYANARRSVDESDAPMQMVGTLQPKYVGFELVRWTKALPREGGEPASRFVCLLGASRAEPRIFVLRPIYLEVRGTKAKIPDIGDRGFSVELDIQLIGAFVKSNQIVEQILATNKWKVGGLSLRGEKKYRTFVRSDDASRYDDAYTAGWFVGVPLPNANADGTFEIDEPEEGRTVYDAGGPFKLTIVATETADSKAPQYLERSAKYLRDNKDTIVKGLSGALGDGATINDYNSP
jgi:hypothetical protein